MIELKRMIRNKLILILCLINILCVILGYILLVTIDGYESVSYAQLLESVYTVYTQFGTLLFSAFIIMQFYIDNKEKNVLFYKALNYSAVRYFTEKILAMIISSAIGTLFGVLLISIVYQSWDLTIVMFVKIECVIIYYIEIASVISFVVGGYIAAFATNFFIWIVGIVVSPISTWTSLFAYYDASTSDYKKCISFLEGSRSMSEQLQAIRSNIVATKVA